MGLKWGTRPKLTFVEKKSSEIQKIAADNVMQHVARLFTVSYVIEMIAIERGGLNKYV